MPVDGACAKRHARTSARRAKSAARMMMDTEVPPALKATSSRSSGSSSTSTGKPKSVDGSLPD